MEDAYKKVEDSISRFEDLQARHLETLEKEELPDLEQQTIEREEEVTRLMETVNHFIEAAKKNNTVDTSSMMLFFNDRISALLDQNEAIETRVKGLRERIKKSMGDISRGKKMIASYQSPRAVSKRPRVLSITN